MFNIYLFKCWARIAGYTSGCSVGVMAGAQTGAMPVCYHSIPGVSAGANDSDNISSSGCTGSSDGARPVRMSVR